MNSPQQQHSSTTETASSPRTLLPNSSLPSPTFLSGLSNYATWSSQIKSTLETASIPQLIQTSIPRPSPSDPSYALWRDTSHLVKNWLLHQLDPPVQTRVLSPNILTQFLSSDTPIFADTLYTIIRRVVVAGNRSHTPTPGLHLQPLRREIAYLDCIRLGREQFHALRDFVAAFRHAVYRANRMRCTVTAYCAALLLLRGVSAEMGGVLVDLERIGGLDGENAPVEYSFQRFDRLCKFLMGREGSEDVGSGSGSGVVGEEDKGNGDRAGRDEAGE